MEEVTKCSYINCSDVHEKRQILHELPVCNTGLCIKWLINSGHEYLIGHDFTKLRTMKFFICNNHFTNDSYLVKGTLKENAVPQPYWNSVGKKANKRTALCLNLDTTNANEQNSEDVHKYNVHNSVQSKEHNKYLAKYNEYCNEWCRTCATKQPNVINMTVKNRSNEMNLLSKLKLLIEIDDEDVLPLNMCYDCVKKLEQSFQFFQQIYIADNTLRHIFPKTQMNGDNCCEVPINSRVSTCNITRPANVVESKDSTSRNNSFRETISKVASIDGKQSTVFSLLTDTCHSDEELDWTDVINVMKRQKSPCITSGVSNCKTQIYCEICNIKFRLRRQLKSHMISEHANLTNRMCMDCVIFFENESLLVDHLNTHHCDNEQYQCDYCRQIFLQKDDLIHHINKLHLTKGIYLCDLCKREFDLKETLSNHIRDVHPYAKYKNQFYGTNNFLKENQVQIATSPCRKRKPRHRV